MDTPAVFSELTNSPSTKPPASHDGEGNCLASLGANAIREGCEIAADEINASGGIEGRRVEIDFQDSQFTPKIASSIAHQFASQIDLKGILISAIGETKAAGPILERAKLPSVTLWDSSPEIDDIGDFAFGIGPWLPSTYEVAANYARERLGAKTAAVIANEQEWSILVKSGFVDIFKRSGGVVVAEAVASTNESDYRTLLLKLVRSKPDVVYAPISSHLSVFFRQLRALGYRGKVITSDNLNDDVIKKAPESIEGVYQTMIATPQNAKLEKVKLLYTAKFHRPADMPIYYAWGYDSVYLLARAISRSNGDRVSVRQQLQETNYEGALGNISFTSEGSWPDKVSVFVVRQGQLVLAP